MRFILRIATQMAYPVVTVIALLGPMPALAASVQELTALALGSTFEVVLPKAEPEHVRYERPLPLELLPYAERNDKFQSIGTAFAIAPEVFVSNAHVLTAGLGSATGHPRLRDASGATFRIDRILRFSLHEDFVVFRASGARASKVLEPASDAPVGARVFAVGNALGEGVVVRDGLLTSLTAEDQDGRWKWLRFSAAASPGNSGGPLLDEEGRVMGVVTARSPGENLNYALPIASVLAGSERSAVIDSRSSFGLPILRHEIVAEFKDSFTLPASWEEFTTRLVRAGEQHYSANQKRLLETYSAELPPRGHSERLVATLERGLMLALIGQQSDDSWGLTELSGQEETRLADGGTLSLGSFDGAFGFTWERAADSHDPAFHRDATAFMDTLLKGMKLPRMIGSQAIRITSLGAPLTQTLHADRFGRTWQLRTWSLGHADLQVVTLALPTPTGYAGLFLFTPAINYRNSVERLRLMADYTHADYKGSAAQWRSFIAQQELCPPALRGLRFGPDADVALSLTGLDVKLPATLLKLHDESMLSVYMGYAAADGRLLTRPAGLTIQEEEDTGNEPTWVGVWAQPRPAEAAGSELAKRWRQMSERKDEFHGKPSHDPEHSRYWTVSAIGDPQGNLMYEVTLSLNEKSLIPRQVNERRDQLLGGLKFRAVDK